MGAKKGSTPWNKININLDEIKKLYISGVSVPIIAKQFNVSDNTIYVRLGNIGITKTNSEAHIGLQVGEKNGNWQGGRRINGAYVMITKSGKLIREHRIIAEQILGRSLKQGEVVHHINGIGTDNSPENITVFPSHSEHMKHHLTHEEAVRRGRSTKRSKAALLLMEVEK